MGRGKLDDWRSWAFERARQAHSRLHQYPLARIVEATILGFQRDRVSDAAAAQTYYGIFSLFPLLLLFMSLVGLALQNNDVARQRILDGIVDLLPQGQNAIRAVITSVVDARGTAAGIGLATLLWGALGWLQVLDDNINRIWGITAGQSFVAGKLRALGMVVGLGVVGLASWVATVAIDNLTPLTNALPGGVVAWQVVVSLLSLVTMGGLFFVLYRVTPRTPLRAADVWPAAVLTALAWEATRRGLDLYLERTNFVSGYGPIGAVMALLFWIYVVNVIVLLGAELTHAIVVERRSTT